MENNKPRFPIPDRLNALLLAFCGMGLSGLIILGSRTESTPAFIVEILLFSLIFLTNYSLFHEASHRKLQSNRFLNDLLGSASGIFFLCPFSIMDARHWHHHLRNRTGVELFDCYHDQTKAAAAYLKWYGYLLGVWYWMIPPTTLLLPFFPERLRMRIMGGKLRFAGTRATDIRDFRWARARFETLATLAFWSAVLYFFSVPLSHFFAFYIFGTILWSGTQYVEHAHSPKEVLTGAYNLKAHPWFSRVALHKEYDLNHHLFPDIPWIYLPQLKSKASLWVENREPQKGFLSAYLNQWRGPRYCNEPEPEPLLEIVSDHSEIIP